MMVVSKKLTHAGLLACAAGILAFSQTGCLYTHVRAPLDQDFDRTELGTKVGRADVRSVAWMVAWGDGGTRAAAENGNISTIRHADVEYRLFLLGLYTRATTIVFGD